MTRSGFISLIAVTIIGVGCVKSDRAVAQPLPVPEVVFELGELTVDSEGQSHSFKIEIADSMEETARGLMFRENLARDAAMLFDFGNPREPSMWMKNTLIPLDMLFLASDGKVVSIARNAQPGSLRQISPGIPVKGVLEINGGLSEELGIEPGDVVRHEIFNNVVAP